ncbi:hypothetical protein MKX03_036865 [Papaver bracteatum]|nr:hypothetical protein MKX03_036865 [Papaver bracteatum]
MATRSLVFSLAFAGLIMLSISHMALGVEKLSEVLGTLSKPIGVNADDLASVQRKGQDQSNLANGEVNRGGTVGVSAVKGLVDVKDGGGVDVDLKNGKVTQGPKSEQVDIANGEVYVERSSIVTVDLQSGQVTADTKTEGNVLGVVNVDLGVTTEVGGVKDGKVTKDVPPVKKSNGNYK